MRARQRRRHTSSVPTRQSFTHVFSLYVPIAVAVFAVVMLTLLFAVVRYRASRGHAPSQKTQHKVLEPLYALVLVGVAAFLAVYAANANASEQAPLGPPKLTVDITGFQWCWEFHYAGTPVTVRSSCVHSDPTLVVPTGEVIRFVLRSDDVVHEWWLPYADWKQEAFPGHSNYFELKFGTTGTWQGRCSEFCGLYHDRMDFFVKAVRPSSFSSFLSSRSKRGVRTA
jgi:cytochrome c oxidase subunit 2